MLAPHSTPLGELTMQLPFEVADYVDFYASEHHATNVGRIFRPGGDAADAELDGTCRSDTTVARARSSSPGRRCGGRPGRCRRPTGGHRPSARAAKLDIEAELGWVVGVGSEPGHPVVIDDFREHVFGVVVLNDWSARDIQAWEYVPLGPFLGKSFATSISAWVLPLDALADAEVALPDPDRPLLPVPARAAAADMPSMSRSCSTAT